MRGSRTGGAVVAVVATLAALLVQPVAAQAQTPAASPADTAAAAAAPDVACRGEDQRQVGGGDAAHPGRPHRPPGCDPAHLLRRAGARPGDRTGEAPAAEAAPFPYADTFRLHSRPGSLRTVYLDFDGETIAGTAWNGSFGAPLDPFFAEPFSIDGSPAFSTAEQDVVQSVWQRVAEDYAPFDIDVTTQDPGPAAITRSGPSDLVFGTRALITDAPEVGNSCGCGGVAYVGVFDATSNHAFYQPAWVVAQALGHNAKYIAEATSHEVGHNLGLSHDGTSSQGYYPGAGAWAPIMGVSLLQAPQPVQQGRVPRRQQLRARSRRHRGQRRDRPSPTTTATPRPRPPASAPGPTWLPSA